MTLAAVDYPYNVQTVGDPLTLTDPDGVARAVQHYVISSTLQVGDGHATVDLTLIYNLYTAPTRDWAFDPALNDMANLPPFTPNSVYFQRVLWDDRLALPFID